VKLFDSQVQKNEGVLRDTKLRTKGKLKLMRLKEKSLNRLKIMLMRLRDKENRLKTEQELMVKVDQAMHNSRKSNQLSDNIQRFNNMKRSLAINAPPMN
jgi:hypothetical protein